MIAVTIATPDYADMASENAEWFRKNSGLETFVMHINERDGYHAKVDLTKYFTGRIIFFDADYRLIRDVRGEISKVLGGGFCGVIETCAEFGGKGTFPFDDCLSTGMNPRSHINTGLFSFDTRNQHHASIMIRARQLLAEKSNGLWKNITDVTDQSLFNLAIHQSGISLNILPIEWNFFTMAFQRGWADFPRKPIGIHAAGVVGPHHKRTHLNELQSVLSRS
jgi:hypothetical protein